MKKLFLLPALISTNIEHLPKVCVKFNTLSLLTMTGLAGDDIQTLRMAGISGFSLGK